jgi:hypothetical protein
MGRDKVGPQLGPSKSVRPTAWLAPPSQLAGPQVGPNLPEKEATLVRKLCVNYAHKSSSVFLANLGSLRLSHLRLGPTLAPAINGPKLQVKLNKLGSNGPKLGANGTTGPPHGAKFARFKTYTYTVGCCWSRSSENRWL